jgi:apolipoprotein N-acyltransferase
MSFSRDIQHTQYRTPRSLNDAFGPYSTWRVERRSEARNWIYVIGSGLAVGGFWWLIVALRVGGGT